MWYKYNYFDMSPEQFENLVVILCKELLGQGVTSFTSGRDGGRDAKFSGKANLIPSETSPWNGKTIVQAKHTKHPYDTFSNPDFFDNVSSIIKQEIPKVKKLVDDGLLDYYMLFSNRRKSANADENIQDYISQKCKIPVNNIFLCGINEIEYWLKKFPEAVKLSEVHPFDMPLKIDPTNIAEIIEVMSEKILPNSINSSITTISSVEKRTGYEKKNELNNMSKEYSQMLIGKYLKYADEIKKFLDRPENEELLKKYEAVKDEFEGKIIIKKKEHHRFDEVIIFLIDNLKIDVTLKSPDNLKLTRAMIFYMYWNCDIGGDYAST